MFDSLQVKAFYSSDENLLERFFKPVLREAISYKRISGYFSANVLANYGNALVEFAKNNGRLQLIVSHEISVEDFQEMKKGYDLRDKLKKELLDLIKANKSIEVETGLSNLAYWIALGTVDIKIAFKRVGLLHSKYGILEDSSGNIIVFTGSNNETNAGLNINYEDFSVTCSWIKDSNDFYIEGIKNKIEKFNQIWSNDLPELDVREIPEILKSEILKYNRGHFTMIQDNVSKYDLSLVCKNNQMQLLFNLTSMSKDKFLGSGIYKTRLKKFIKDIHDDRLIFRPINITDYNKIKKVLERICSNLNLNLYIDDSIINFLESKNLYINERINIGQNIKAHDPSILKHFEQFKSVVNEQFKRRLRDNQLWDAFFMYAMKRSANFSVPGSGKTSSALAVYAYLRQQNNFNNIIVVGPKNSFDSWKTEFKECFGDKIPIRCFDCHDSSLGNDQNKISLLKYECLRYNIFLFNYESLSKYIEYIDEILKQNKTLLIYDEVHRVKRIDGEWANAACNTSKYSTYTIVMTGTPIPNSYLDIYNFLNILFPDDYKNFFGFDQWSLANPSDKLKVEINDRLRPFYCRTSKDDLGVPRPRADIEVINRVESTENQIFSIIRKAYRKNPLALLIRILQLESNPKLLAEKIDSPEIAGRLSHILDIDERNIADLEFKDYSDDVALLLNRIGEYSSKREKCIEIVKNLVCENKSVIIWCIFKQSMDDLLKGLLSMGIAAEIVNGSVPQDERTSILNSFKSRKIKVLITNPHTLAESVSLHTVCHDAIYFEYSFNLVHLLQSKDRIHRLGLPNNQYTQYWYLENYYDIEGETYSLDQNIYQRLLDKEQIMLDAISQQSIESVTTTEEDLELVLGKLLDK